MCLPISYKIGPPFIECQSLVCALDVFPENVIRKSEHISHFLGTKSEYLWKTEFFGKTNRTNGVKNTETSFAEYQQEGDVAKLWMD